MVSVVRGVRRRGRRCVGGGFLRGGVSVVLGVGFALVAASVAVEGEVPRRCRRWSPAGSESTRWSAGLAGGRPVARPCRRAWRRWTGSWPELAELVVLVGLAGSSGSAQAACWSRQRRILAAVITARSWSVSGFSSQGRGGAGSRVWSRWSSPGHRRGCRCVARGRTSWPPAAWVSGRSGGSAGRAAGWGVFRPVPFIRRAAAERVRLHARGPVRRSYGMCARCRCRVRGSGVRSRARRRRGGGLHEVALPAGGVVLWGGDGVPDPEDGAARRRRSGTHRQVVVGGGRGGVPGDLAGQGGGDRAAPVELPGIVRRPPARRPAASSSSPATPASSRTAGEFPGPAGLVWPVELAGPSTGTAVVGVRMTCRPRRRRRLPECAGRRRGVGWSRGGRGGRRAEGHAVDEFVGADPPGQRASPPAFGGGHGSVEVGDDRGDRFPAGLHREPRPFRRGGPRCARAGWPAPWRRGRRRRPRRPARRSALIRFATFGFVDRDTHGRPLPGPSGFCSGSRVSRTWPGVPAATARTRSGSGISRASTAAHTASSATTPVPFRIGGQLGRVEQAGAQQGAGARQPVGQKQRGRRRPPGHTGRR